MSRLGSAGASILQGIFGDLFEEAGIYLAHDLLHGPSPAAAHLISADGKAAWTARQAPEVRLDATGTAGILLDGEMAVRNPIERRLQERPHARGRRRSLLAFPVEQDRG